MKRIIITGPKSSGKSNIGLRLSALLNVPFFDLDEVLENIYARTYGRQLSFREIYRRHGEATFRELEHKAAKEVAKKENILLSTGGTTFTLENLRKTLLPNSYVILLTNDPAILWDRTSRKGLPSYLAKSSDPQAEFYLRVEKVVEVVTPLAQMKLNTEELSIEDVAQLLDVELQRRNISLTQEN